ncbi:hypothetical protein L873DRAFT_328827 [Choiromyces venosus 120613-1]|uniref:IBR domain-containing protein n=1 Tax=Choiromyces venosus 120613-1 TaxID=1336337 RepID=A0A3N4K148_9PEZI|nr:hypothetical protein L873DRAFT_328827 [Choiromyces venosus 120613-1]
MPSPRIIFRDDHEGLWQERPLYCPVRECGWFIPQARIDSHGVGTCIRCSTQSCCFCGKQGAHADHMTCPTVIRMLEDSDDSDDMDEFYRVLERHSRLVEIEEARYGDAWHAGRVGGGTGGSFGSRNLPSDGISLEQLDLAAAAVARATAQRRIFLDSHATLSESHLAPYLTTSNERNSGLNNRASEMPRGPAPPRPAPPRPVRIGHSLHVPAGPTIQTIPSGIYGSASSSRSVNQVHDAVQALSPVPQRGRIAQVIATPVPITSRPATGASGSSTNGNLVAGPPVPQRPARTIPTAATPAGPSSQTIPRPAIGVTGSASNPNQVTGSNSGTQVRRPAFSGTSGLRVPGGAPPVLRMQGHSASSARANGPRNYPMLPIPPPIPSYIPLPVATSGIGTAGGDVNHPHWRGRPRLPDRNSAPDVHELEVLRNRQLFALSRRARHRAYQLFIATGQGSR